MSFDNISAQETITVRKVFANLVELIKPEYPSLNFYFSYWENVANEMVSGGKSNKAYEFDKYPLIFLHADLKEDKEKSFDVYAEIDPKIYILARTKATYTFEERYNKVFVAVLYPIYDLLIEKMKSSEYFKLDGTKSIYPMIPHTKHDLYYIGSLDKNQNALNEFVDAIELNFSKLQINKHLKF